MELTAFHPFKSEQAKEKYLSLYETRSKLWPIASENKLVDTSYGPTFVRISGTVDSRPLVLLPGAGCNSLMWIPNIESLSTHYRTYAIDNIYDNGRSAYTRPVQTPTDFVNWLDDLFTVLRLGNDINLMGLSYGGWLTSMYAVHHPERLAKIVLLAPAGTVLPLSTTFIFRIFLCVLPPQRFFSRSMMNWLLSDWAHKDESSRKIVEDSADDMLVAAQCYKPKPGVSVTVLNNEELKSIKTPALYMVGANEKIYSPRKAVERLNRVAPQIKTELLPHAGHDLNFSQAEMVNRKVLEFLKSD